MPAKDLLRGAVRRALGTTSWWTGSLFGPLPVNDRGVTLDAETHALLGMMERLGRPTFDQIGPVAARAEMTKLSWLGGLGAPALHRVEDRRIEGPKGPLPVRIFTPTAGGDAPAAPHPALVYLHGGGFVIGDLDSCDGVCRQLAALSSVVVVAVDYRLAPEHPFPAAGEDVGAAFRWVRAHADELRIDPDRIAVGGDSAGGNLSAVLCQELRDAGEPMPAFQLLIYPATDMTRSCDSHRHLGDGFFLTQSLLDWFLANYLTDPPTQETDPRCSPLATRDLAGLPPAHVVVAGFDPLRDEGEAYADALAAAGVPVTVRCYGSLIHGFVSMGALIEAAQHGLEDIAAALRHALWDEPSA